MAGWACPRKVTRVSGLGIWALGSDMWGLGCVYIQIYVYTMYTIYIYIKAVVFGSSQCVPEDLGFRAYFV